MTINPDSALLNTLKHSGRTISTDDEDIRGRTVKDSDGHDIGKVEDLLVDERHHRVRFMLIEHGGFLGLGRTRSLIPVEDITAIGAQQVAINHTKDHVCAGPEYDPELVSDQPYQASVHEHYGTTPYWGVGYGYPNDPFSSISRSSW